MKYLLFCLLAACSGKSYAEEEMDRAKNKESTFQVVLATYPPRELECHGHYWGNCGATLTVCTDKATGEYWDWVRCVPALIRSGKE